MYVVLRTILGSQPPKKPNQAKSPSEQNDHWIEPRGWALDRSPGSQRPIFTMSLDSLLGPLKCFKFFEMTAETRHFCGGHF